MSTQHERPEDMDMETWHDSLKEEGVFAGPETIEKSHNFYNPRLRLEQLPDAVGHPLLSQWGGPVNRFQRPDGRTVKRSKKTW